MGLTQLTNLIQMFKCYFIFSLFSSILNSHDYQGQSKEISQFHAKWRNGVEINKSHNFNIILKSIKFSFLNLNMINAQKRVEEKSCNCRNSKCMKLYCECFAARLHCGKNCHCIDCHNNLLENRNRQVFYAERRPPRDELIKVHKGCACKRTGCTKKYCECFQSGLLCKQTCRCVDCQNNQSLTNKKVITQLRRNNSDISNIDNSQSLYPIYLSQNSEHMNSIISDANPLRLGERWLEDCAKSLYESAGDGQVTSVLDQLIAILKGIEENISCEPESLRECHQEVSNSFASDSQHQRLNNKGQMKVKIENKAQQQQQKQNEMEPQPQPQQADSLMQEQNANNSPHSPHLQ